ncbi:MAG: rhodanese-like domain-containing protein, partial [Bacteroidota bacterium]
MRTLFFILTCALLLSTGAAEAQRSPTRFDRMLKDLLQRDVPEVTVKEADSLKAAIFLDAREKREFEVSHIQGARWVGYNDFDTSRIGSIPNNTPVVVYCSVGARSEDITRRLQSLGVKDVYNLYGGIFAWKNAGKSVYAGKQTTEKVHAYDRNWGRWLESGEKVYR